MTHDHNIERFINEPSLLVAACRQVIDRLAAGSYDTETREKEAQLREISKTIKRLEKATVPIPDALRAEKTRLASALGVKNEGCQSLNQLADELETVVKDLKTRLGRDGDAKGPKGSRRSHSPRTDKHVLSEYLIQALKKLGGRARPADVIEEIGRQLDGKLLPGDLEWRKSTNEYVWQNNVKWQRYRLIEKGRLRSDSPHGFWELSEDTQ